MPHDINVKSALLLSSMINRIIFIFALFQFIFVNQLISQQDSIGKESQKLKVIKEQKEKKSSNNVDSEKKEKKKKPVPARKPKIAPPGTVMLNDSLYIDVNPIKNIDYREFISFLSITYSKEVRDSLDRLPYWGLDYDGFRKFMRLSGNDRELLGRVRIRLDQVLSWAQSLEEYLNNPAFNNNPLVCVSFNQANEYAAWRTRIVMFKWAVDSKDEKQRSRFYTRIRYRLMKPEEWDMAMDKYADNVILNKAIFPHNIACTYPAVPQKRKAMLYYVPGNVAEMTDVENLAVGLSWIDNDTTVNYKKRVQYYAPRDWLGFRCVCEIVEY
jgi:hypothetical protein